LRVPADAGGVPARSNETSKQWHERALDESHAASDAFDLLRTRHAPLRQVLLHGAIGGDDDRTAAALARLDEARIELLLATEALVADDPHLLAPSNRNGGND
jgi:hypothetical protein